MGILQITTDTAGQINVNPRRVKIISSDSLATVTTAGYLNPVSLQGFVIENTDVIDMWYGATGAVGGLVSSPGTYSVFTPSISNGVITLVAWANPGDVLLPVVSGHIATFNGTSGQIGDLSTPAVHGGNIQAGLSGTAGTLSSYPATASKGSLVIAGVANTGNTNTTISNAAMGQASVISIPDPAGATANFALAPSALVSGNLVKASGTAGLLVDQGVAMKSVAQAAVAGGAAAQTVTDAFCTSAACVVASWNDTTNAVSIQKVAAGNGSFVVTSSGDPGASHLNYIITK